MCLDSHKVKFVFVLPVWERHSLCGHLISLRMLTWFRAYNKRQKGEWFIRVLLMLCWIPTSAPQCEIDTTWHTSEHVRVHVRAYVRASVCSVHDVPCDLSKSCGQDAVRASFAWRVIWILKALSRFYKQTACLLSMLDCWDDIFTKTL